MNIDIYKAGHYAGQKEVPKDIIDKCYKIAKFMVDTGTASIYGIGPLWELQRQLAEVTRERDQLQAALKLSDALRNRQMGGGK